MPVKKDAEWWKNYRARKAERTEDAPAEQALAKEGEKIAIGHPDTVKETHRVTKVEPEVVEVHEIGEDRLAGLPRSNYYGDWVRTIQKMDGHLINKILDHPSIKTSSREKK